MSKLFTDEIQKTGLYNRPIQVINAGLNMAFAEATVTNFDGLVEVTLDLSLGNYFVLDMNKCNSDVKEINLINSQNSAFNSFVLEVHQVKSGTPLYIDWSVMTSFKWSEGVQPILKNTYNSVDIYSFMNVGGYIYLTQENDTDRLNDTDYAIRLEDDESIITETFTMSYVIGAILSIELTEIMAAPGSLLDPDIFNILLLFFDELLYLPTTYIHSNLILEQPTIYI